jgi:hypothetical protein
MCELNHTQIINTSSINVGQKFFEKKIICSIELNHYEKIIQIYNPCVAHIIHIYAFIIFRILLILKSLDIKTFFTH